MSSIVPYFAETASATIVIDGVTYRVPLIDSDGHIQVDVLTAALPTGAATSAKQDTMITALQLIDDLRAALDSVQTDRLNVNAKATGAGEVLAALLLTVDPSTTRATVATPTSGKKIRIVSCAIRSDNASVTNLGVYFGTGATIHTTAGKEIMEATLGRDTQSVFGLVWPDGGGPVGAVDDVVSLHTTSNITTSGLVVIHYREE